MGISENACRCARDKNVLDTLFPLPPQHNSLDAASVTHHHHATVHNMGISALDTPAKAWSKEVRDLLFL
jgi:hypothetical protein